MSGTILLMDNTETVLDKVGKLLEKGGYDVIRAATLDRARDTLRARRVHLAILDVRMVDDDDENDISGLLLAQEPEFAQLPKIMLTAYPSFEGVRLALRANAEGRTAAINFIDKAEGPKALKAAVEEAFAKQVLINWGLDIRWGRDEQLPPASLASHISPEMALDRLPERVGALEDLLRKLFYDYSQLTLGRILTRREGWVLLTAFAYRDGGDEEQFLVACGQPHEVRTETEGHDLFHVDKTEGILAKSVETIHFGAAAYRIGGHWLEGAVRLSEFYHRHSAQEVSDAVKSLFRSTLRSRYRRGQEQQDRSLEAFLQAWLDLQGRISSQAELDERTKSICNAVRKAGLGSLDYSAHRLTLSSSQGIELSVPNPAPYLYQGRVAISPPTLCGTIHGRLDAERVLVDQTGGACVVDFGKTGTGPLVRDFSTLENAIKFDVLRGMGIAERGQLETCLLAMSTLEDSIDVEGPDPAMAKALRVISHVRSQAAGIVGHDMEPYLAALLYSAAERFIAYSPKVRYTRQELLAFAHALLSMAAICQRLFSWKDHLRGLPAQASESLWVDADNMEVWVEGRRIDLAGQGFDLLKYMYDRAGQLCRRSDLATDVLGMDLSGYHPAEQEDLTKSTINTAIRRLRKSIEPNPSHPKYVRTVRGAGYRLDLGDPPTNGV